MLWMLTACSLLRSGVATTDPPTPDTDTTAPDTDPPVVEVHYRAYDEDLDCWVVRFVERPAEYWQSWVDNGCNDNQERPRVYWMSEGHCGYWAQALDEGGPCQIDDPTGWFSSCNPDEHACCAAVQIGDTGRGTPIPSCTPPP